MKETPTIVGIDHQMCQHIRQNAVAKSIAVQLAPASLLRHVLTAKGGAGGVGVASIDGSEAQR